MSDVPAHLPNIPMPRPPLAAILAPELRRQISDPRFGIVATLKRLGKESADMATSLAENFHVVPVSQITDLDPMSRTRKRNRIVVRIAFLLGISGLMGAKLVTKTHSKMA